MNPIVQALLWCPLQITVLVIAALAIDALVGRRRPAAGALVGVLSLTAVVGLTAAALSPWPSWNLPEKLLSARSATSPAETVADSWSIDASASTSANRVREQGRSDKTARPQFGIAFDEPSPVLERLWTVIAGNWLLLVAVLYLVGVTAMAARFLIGLAAVRSYRLQSRPLTDRSLVELAEAVRSQLGCVRIIELRETDALDTPATIGWRRPLLLLPRDWPSWTEDERRAVLAHEIEHVRRSDFASWIVAQIGLALHFYHPLVHWLAARLRLKQELAADAAAARAVGGQGKYLATLAGMALRRSDAPVAWPAHAFIPSSKTFLRRIEMLHRWKSLRPDVSRPFFVISVAAVALAALGAAGIRGSAANSSEEAAKSRTNLKMLALAMHNYHAQHKHLPTAAVPGPDGKTLHSWRVELLPLLDQQALYDQYRVNEPWDSADNKKVLEQMPDVFRSPFDKPKSTNSGYYVFAGPGAVFDGDKGLAFSDITDGTSNTLLMVEAKRDTPWTKPEDIAFDPTIPPTKVRGFVDGQLLGALVDGSVRSFDADSVKDQLVWLIQRRDGFPIDWKKITASETPQPASQFGLFLQEPDGGKSARDGNNLKELALAMYGYHDKHGHFPPAVVMGPDGKTPHSWRVELLPFLSQQGLYDQYRMNEAWDSPNNKTVLAQIPGRLRSPYQDPNSTDTGYFVIVGPGTVFDPMKTVQISDVRDGTSNTFLIVEAKRNVPWTKPEDIPFDPHQAVPTLGGFVPGQLWVAMCDGSAHRLASERVKDSLKLLIMRDDGQPVDLQALGMAHYASRTMTIVAAAPPSDAAADKSLPPGTKFLGVIKNLTAAQPSDVPASKSPTSTSGNVSFFVTSQEAARSSDTVAIDVRSAGLEVTLKGDHVSSITHAATAPYTAAMHLDPGEYRLSIKSTARSPFREYVSKEPLSIKSGRQNRIVVEFVDKSRDVKWTGFDSVDVVATFDNQHVELVPASGTGSSQK
jgi:beta-lactamase regulating signal transducer with metallopeptidase domain